MYESPIEIIQGELQTKFEDGILKAVEKCDIHCNKEELIKALAYDRYQYQKGFEDGKASAERKWDKLFNYISNWAFEIAPDETTKKSEVYEKHLIYDNLQNILIVMMDLKILEENNNAGKDR